MRRYNEPIGDHALHDEIQEIWDAIKKIGQSSMGIIHSPGFDAPNLFIQQDDPGPLDFPYEWLELNPDDTIRRVWKWTP